MGQPATAAVGVASVTFSSVMRSRRTSSTQSMKVYGFRSRRAWVTPHFNTLRLSSYDGGAYSWRTLSFFFHGQH